MVDLIDDKSAPIHPREKRRGTPVEQPSSFLADLYRQEYPTLYRVAYRLTGCQEDAQDMIQKTFLLAISQQDELGRHPNPGGWLMVTLRQHRINAKIRIIQWVPN